VPRTTVNVKNPAELEKKIPISKKGESRTIVHVDVAPFEVGDLIESHGEVEVSVTCTEPAPKCVGKRYTHSPQGRGEDGARQGSRPHGVSPR